MTRETAWRGRGATLEALLWLVLARLLVAVVPFGRWRKWLGAPVQPETSSPAKRLDANLAQRRLARAVERAAGRLPGESLCLPRAIALQWMLRRRNFGGVIHIGVRPSQQRGSLDDLHAWVTRDGEVLIGANEVPHAALFAAENPDSVS